MHRVSKKGKMKKIESEMRKNIEQKLIQIEKEFDIEIIVAVESGSRAWGFESTDSDYDVRFIYKHKIDWYFQVLPKRDVIELPIHDLDDYSGWDIKKALFLLNKSNPVLIEWINSPIIYKKNEKDFTELQNASLAYFNPISSMYHYLSMAKSNYHDYLRGEFVKSKKYFYALRPILACMWIDTYKETPPIEFEILKQQIQDKQLLDTIDNLLIRKKSGIELGEEKRIELINSFIELHITLFEKSVSEYTSNKKTDSDFLDKVLINILKG